jgi:hypothetical protein
MLQEAEAGSLVIWPELVCPANGTSPHWDKPLKKPLRYSCCSPVNEDAGAELKAN